MTRTVMSMALPLVLFLVVSSGYASTIAKLTNDFPNEKKSFVSLAAGQTHYQIEGPLEGKPVVLIHGVSGPMKVWDFTVDQLARAGFRVIRFDLFGRGFSQRIEREYDLDLFVSQLHELLTKLKVTRPVSLVGSSMGAIVSSEFASQFPDAVDKLVLIGPAGFPLKVSPLAKLRDIPVLGPLIDRSFAQSVIVKQNKNYFFDPERAQRFLSYFRSQLQLSGSVEAILSTMSHVPVQDYRTGYSKIASTEHPTLVIWGKQDKTFPFHNHLTLKELVPQMKLLAIDNAAHLPQYEAPNQTSSAIAQFIRKGDVNPRDLPTKP